MGVRGRIIGVGSPFGSDQAGWFVLEALRGAGFAERFPEIALETLDRPGPRLLERMAGMESVILVDALLGGTPGAMRVVHREDLATGEADFSSHGFGVAEALTLAEALGDLPKRLAVIGIEVGDGVQDVSWELAPIVECIAEILARQGFGDT